MSSDFNFSKILNSIKPEPSPEDTKIQELARKNLLQILEDFDPRSDKVDPQLLSVLSAISKGF